MAGKFVTLGVEVTATPGVLYTLSVLTMIHAKNAGCRQIGRTITATAELLPPQFVSQQVGVVPFAT
jgi:hypothetical protein